MLIRFAILAGVISIATFASSAEPSEATVVGTAETFSVSVTANKEYICGQDCTVQLELKNLVDTELVIEYYRHQLYRFEVIDEAGHKCRLTRFGEQNWTGSYWSTKELKVNPKSSIKGSINLSRYFDLTVEGKYTVNVYFKKSVSDAKSSTVCNVPLNLIDPLRKVDTPPPDDSDKKNE